MDNNVNATKWARPAFTKVDPYEINTNISLHNGEFSVKKVKKRTISQNFGNELVKTYRIQKCIHQVHKN